VTESVLLRGAGFAPRRTPRSAIGCRRCAKPAPLARTSLSSNSVPR